MATQTHVWLGTVLLLEGNHEGARLRFEEGLTLGRSLGDRLSICIALFNLAQLALAGGDYEAASRWFAEGIAPSEELGDRGQVAHILEGLGIVAGARGEAGRAARLLGASEALINAIGLRGHTYYRPDRALYERVEAGARAKLGEAAFEAALGEGRAIEYALLEEQERKSPTLVSVPEQKPPPAGARAERLTHREQEIALLVGRGLTNRQIAQELSISERTVEKHIGKILKKLGFSSRARIAAWVAHR
jgi:DNA-binding CsgD family transcriptional regulator